MSGQQRTVEELVAELVERMEADPATDLDALLALHPEHGSEIRRRIDILRAAGLLPRAPGNGTRTPDPLGPIRQRLERRGDFPLRYALAGELGRGGMGRILEAREDDLQRTVAMKVFHPRDGNGAPDPALVGRFLHEARITARLDHPGIVPVHELGLDDQGQLYFTMRMVSGEDLRQVYEHVATGHDGWNQPRALGVLLKVCEALGYAHEKHVIHRDLKPANVMVGKHGEVYVMDWGLARVLGQHDPFDLRIRPEVDSDPAETPPGQSGREHASDSPLVTRNGDIVGTPAYMPPEQARGDLAALGPQSDVYAVGAMLYQLLAGTMPFVAHGQRPSPRAILRRVLAGPPVALAELAPKAPPELVAICEKAMARESAQRYANTTELAEDLRAFLELRMVRAYRTGAWVEARKWVQRNTPLALALLGVVLALTVGSIAFKLKADEATRTADFATKESQRADAQATQADQNAQKAREEAARADQNAAEATKSALAAQAETAKAEEARKLAEKRAEETQVVANFQSEMITKISVDEFGHGMVVELERALTEELKRRGIDDAEIEAASTALGTALAPANPTTAASRLLKAQVLDRELETIGKEFSEQPLIKARLLSALGAAAARLGSYEMAEAAQREAVETQRSILGAASAETLQGLGRLGRILRESGRASEAEPLFREALAGCRREFGDDDKRTIQSMTDLTAVLLGRDRRAEAEPLLREAVERSRRVLGDTEPTTLTAISNLAQLLEDRSQLEEAEGLLRESLAGCRKSLGDDHPDTLTSINNLAVLLGERHKFGEVEALYREGLAGSRRRLGDDHIQTLYAMGNLAVHLNRTGKRAEGEQLLKAAVAGCRRTLGESDPSTITFTTNLALLTQSLGRPAEAEHLLREAYAAAHAEHAGDNSSALRTAHALGEFLQAAGRSREAEPFSRESLAACRQRFGEDDRKTLVETNGLAVILQSLDQLPEAETLFRKCLDQFRRVRGNADPDTLKALDNLAKLLQLKGENEEAELLTREGVLLRRQAFGDDNPQTVSAILDLANLLTTSGKLKDAEPLWLEGLERRRQAIGANHPETKKALQAVVGFYYKWHDLEPAAGHDAQAKALESPSPR